MYNKFLVDKKRKQNEKQTRSKKSVSNWLEQYHSRIQPDLLDKYNQRINNFISKIQDNPAELERFQAADIKKQKQQHLKERTQQLSRKGGRILKFRDATDFNSYFSETQRIQRSKNKMLFQQKYGSSDMAYRSIASQSEYNPRLMNQFRSRDKPKQINPPMRHISNIQALGQNMHRKSKSVCQGNRRSNHLKNESNRQQQVEYDQAVRKSTSYTNSLIGIQDQIKSVNQNRDQSQASHDSHRNLRKFVVTLQRPIKRNEKQSNKSYFVGITDIKQNSKDSHLKKTLQNILVRIGKSRPNQRGRTSKSSIEILSTDIN